MTVRELFRNEDNKANAIYMGVFGVLIFVLAGMVWLVDRRFPYEISVFDFILISLATFRLVRLFVYDHVTLFIRTYLADSSHGFKKATSDLFDCPWCFGVWAATFLIVLYFLVPMMWFVILILAVAGVASFVQMLSNMVGWRAEQLKHEVGVANEDVCTECHASHLK